MVIGSFNEIEKLRKISDSEKGELAGSGKHGEEGGKMGPIRRNILGA